MISIDFPCSIAISLQQADQSHWKVLVVSIVFLSSATQGAEVARGVRGVLDTITGEAAG